MEKVIVNKIILHVEGLRFKDKGVPQSINNYSYFT